MVLESPRTVEREATSLSFYSWKERIFIPTLLAGFAGGGVGFFSKYRKVYGLAFISALYALLIWPLSLEPTALVLGYLNCNGFFLPTKWDGAREFVRVSGKAESDDLVNSAIFGTAGATLGHFQGGRAGAIRYSIMFCAAGAIADHAFLKLKPILTSYKESLLGGKNADNKSEKLKLQEWSPIQMLDEEALAPKNAEEEQLHQQIAIDQFNDKE